MLQEFPFDLLICIYRTFELKNSLLKKLYKFPTEIFRGMFFYIRFMFSSGCPFVGSPCGAVFEELLKPFV